MHLEVEHLYSRAKSLFAKFRHDGGTNYIVEAIVLDREALEICPPDHRMRSVCLSQLGIHLWHRYQQSGVISDLEEAVTLDRETLKLRPQGHPDRPVSLNNLAVRLWTRSQQLGRMDDLDEAIVLNREALKLCARSHPDHSPSLNNLGVCLFTRYEQLRMIEDLDEVIALDRDALKLRPQGHPNRSTSLNNLAIHLLARHENLCRMEDLNETIILGREALGVRPQGHPDRSRSLNTLARCLASRYTQLRAVEDLDEAIVLDREALRLRSHGHPGCWKSLITLGCKLFTRYRQLGRLEDLDEVIILSRESLKFRPQGHPLRSGSLDKLTGFLQIRFTRSGQLKDQEELFTVYAELVDMPHLVSSSDLSAARAWIRTAEEHRHQSTLPAYETCLRLLVQHLATLPSLPQHLTILKNHTSSLAVDAFSACLRNHAPARAVELLEQGRGVFWSQLTRLRSTLDDVIAFGPTGKMLADKFTHLTSDMRHAFNSSGTGQHEWVWHLNIELQRVVDNIRTLPGLSRFLLPSLFSDLQRAASAGPVIIVNASKYSCDALVVLVDRDPIHVPLSITQEYVRLLSSRLRTLTAHAQSMDVTRDLGVIMREIWDDTVSPIVRVLETIYPHQSRIWWCPTAEFSLLPLHAAGPYRKGQPNLSDLYVSSYTPTLSALIRARQPCSSNSSGGSKRFIAIGQANAIGQSELLSVGSELGNIGRLVDGLATFTQIQGPESCISRVCEELGKNEWVHFACHGIANQQKPFESAFALHDGRFTVQRIIQCELEGPEFAYLSACHTTVGDEESPDEVIHLASAMQFAGFRSVIGTMWAVDDEQTNKVTSAFYRFMVEETGSLDHTRAAYALNKTMRTVTVPLDQRILYIHLGV